MYHLGLDAGQNCSSIAILNSEGKTFKQLEVKGRWPVVLGTIAGLKLQRPINVCFEASSGYGYLYEQLNKLANGGHVAVAHPGHLRLIFKSKKKHRTKPRTKPGRGRLFSTGKLG